MSKIFYDHLVILEEVVAELDKHNPAVEEREELVQLIRENLHHRVWDVILTNLPKEKHEQFLTRFHKKPHDEELIEYLRVQTKVNIEVLILEEAKKVKKELIFEIHRAKKK